MKCNVLRICPALAIIASLSLSSALGQDKPASATTKPPSSKPDAPDPAEMMKKMEQFATPGPGHKVLNGLAGEWEAVARFWMGGPDAPATESKGTNKARWILGGRYLQEEFTGEMMGMPFQGVGLTGYDNFNKQYVSIWMDTMGTGMLKSEGTADAEGKVITFHGKMDEPTTGEKQKPVKFVLRILSPDKHVFEMHDLNLGEKSKVGEITYTRK